jgi:VCBS repeat-containing protein
VLANGSDSRGLSLTAQQVSPPTNASSFTLNSDGTFTYTPASNFNGTDTFTYQAANSLSNTSNVVTVTVTVTITVTLVNDAPVVTSDSISTAEDGTLTASVAGTISDVENNTVTVQLVSGPSNAASFNLSNDGSFTYVPTADFNSTDSFTYWATDSLGCNPVQVGWSHR